MRLTSVLAFCATVYGLAISNVLNGTDISSKAWREAEKVVGRPLQNNKYYYFMSCNPAYRNHRQTREPYLKFQKKFEAEYFHVRVLDSKPGEWSQTRHKWDGPVIDQRITYKGQKASVNIKDLWNYGKEWVAAAGKKIDANHNCLRSE
ncbi:hypothetical protein CGGC5_v010319 [Colletotrichum fructicola Nara gc5]|uniref:Uncharacterized protein n=1 Tax=Colletotrichum fructicola (strain Nara gc5) TaxID=1213859 RepID=A0A7J6IU34_COLFN|nr:hypothetical protein CGGC5_v010319 [Colletotrichum fructicola Nara gc5]